MSNTVKITEPFEPMAPASEPALAQPGAALPVIAPQMAQVLELANKSQSSVTPREINEHLSRILQSYDTLTAQYGQNSLRIDAELDQLRQSGGAVSAQLHQLNADMQQQGDALSGLAGATSANLQALTTAQSQQEQAHQRAVAQSEARHQQQAAELETRIYVDVARLDSGLHSVEKLLGDQQQIIAEQTQRLDQFDVAYELLDTATRGNRKRIEAVREEAQKQHAVLSAQVQGLGALQREHYTEFNQVRSLVGVLQTEAQRLDEKLHTVATELTHHVARTQTTFRWTHGALAAVLLLTAGGFALVKWSPAFTPETSLVAQAQSAQNIATLQAQLPALETRALAQGSQMSQLQSTVNTLQTNLGDLKKSVDGLNTRVGNTEAAALILGAATGSLAVQDPGWVQQQDPRSYTVQLMGADRPQALAAFLRQNAPLLGGAGVAYTVTQPQGSTRYNLFYGVFDSPDAARTAIDSLPDELRITKPWVRQFGAVQNAAR